MRAYRIVSIWVILFEKLSSVLLGCRSTCSRVLIDYVYVRHSMQATHTRLRWHSAKWLTIGLRCGWIWDVLEMTEQVMNGPSDARRFFGGKNWINFNEKHTNTHPVWIRSERKRKKKSLKLGPTVRIRRRQKRTIIKTVILLSMYKWCK